MAFFKDKPGCRPECCGSECWFPAPCFSDLCDDLNNGNDPEHRRIPCFARLDVAGVSGSQINQCCNCSDINASWWLRYNGSNVYVANSCDNVLDVPLCWQVNSSWYVDGVGDGGFKLFQLTLSKPSSTLVLHLEHIISETPAPVGGAYDVVEYSIDTGEEECIGLGTYVLTRTTPSYYCNWPATLTITFFDEMPLTGRGDNSQIIDCQPKDVFIQFSGVANGSCDQCENLFSGAFNLQRLSASSYRWVPDEKNCGCEEFGQFSIERVELIIEGGSYKVKIHDGTGVILGWTSSQPIPGPGTIICEEEFPITGWTKTTDATGEITECDFSSISLDSVTTRRPAQESCDHRVQKCWLCNCETPTLRVFGFDQWANAHDICYIPALNPDGSMDFVYEPFLSRAEPNGDKYCTWVAACPGNSRIAYIRIWENNQAGGHNLLFWTDRIASSFPYFYEIQNIPTFPYHNNPQTRLLTSPKTPKLVDCFNINRTIDVDVTWQFGVVTDTYPMRIGVAP